jgi:hypothetical protein
MGRKARDDIRTHHDEWVKRALSLWLGALGDVLLDARIAGQSRHGDILYTGQPRRLATAVGPRLPSHQAAPGAP